MHGIINLIMKKLKLHWFFILICEETLKKRKCALLFLHCIGVQRFYKG